jgi:hypothetical protein
MLARAEADATGPQSVPDGSGRANSGDSRRRRWQGALGRARPRAMAGQVPENSSLSSLTWVLAGAVLRYKLGGLLLGGELELLAT